MQTRTEPGRVDGPPTPGAAILNAGIMLAHVTNQAIPAGPHRAVAAPSQAVDRISGLQFARPAPWHVLAPLPTCVDDDNPLRYPSLQAQDALAKVLWEINMSEGGGRARPAG